MGLDVDLDSLNYLLTWATKTCRHADYVYQLTSHPTHGFFTGKSADGGKHIIGTFIRHILWLTFDSAGKYKKTTPIKLESKIDPDLRRRFPDDEDPERRELFENEQITECAIGIRAFFDCENDVGIRDLPSTYADYLKNEARYLSRINEGNRREEKDLIETGIQSWKIRGDYVFWWGNEYYVNTVGEVVFS